MAKEVDSREKELTHQVHREWLQRASDQVKQLTPALVSGIKIFITTKTTQGFCYYFTVLQWQKVSSKLNRAYLNTKQTKYNRIVGQDHVLDAIVKKILLHWYMPKIHYARFPVTSPIDGEVASLCGLVSDTSANKSATSWQQVVVMEFGKQHDTTDFCLCQLVMDLSFMLRTCYREVTNLCGLATGKLV